MKGGWILCPWQLPFLHILSAHLPSLIPASMVPNTAPLGLFQCEAGTGKFSGKDLICYTSVYVL